MGKSVTATYLQTFDRGVPVAMYRVTGWGHDYLLVFANPEWDCTDIYACDKNGKGLADMASMSGLYEPDEALRMRGFTVTRYNFLEFWEKL